MICQMRDSLQTPEHAMWSISAPAICQPTTKERIVDDVIYKMADWLVDIFRECYFGLFEGTVC